MQRLSIKLILCEVLHAFMLGVVGDISQLWNMRCSNRVARYGFHMCFGRRL